MCTFFTHFPIASNHFVVAAVVTLSTGTSSSKTQLTPSFAPIISTHHRAIRAMITAAIVRQRCLAPAAAAFRSVSGRTNFNEVKPNKCGSIVRVIGQNSVSRKFWHINDSERRPWRRCWCMCACVYYIWFGMVCLCSMDVDPTCEINANAAKSERARTYIMYDDI